MPLVFKDEPVPLHIDQDGVVRVAQTRVTLDTVVAAFHEGATAEEIAQQYPTVGLPDICAVIAFHLRRRDEVDAYLHERAEFAAAVRRENERRTPNQGIRERLLARVKRDAA